RRDGRGRRVGLADPVQLQDGGHWLGTSTRSPACRSDVLTCTSVVANSPGVTPTSSRPAARSTYTPYPPPARATRAVIGTASTPCTARSVTLTVTGAWSRSSPARGFVSV